MNTSLKVILTAIGIAALASPVMAKSNSYRYAAPLPATISNAQGSVAAPVVEGNPFRIDDAVHVPFPQQGGGN